MKAAVCFKAVKELEKVLPTDWQSFDGVPDTSYVGTLIGCYDEAALEMALRLKDKNRDTELTALTFGNLPNNHARRLFAAGFQNVICLKSENIEFSPFETAERLSDWLKNNPQDLIICGSRTALNDTGSVPYYLASLLGLKAVPEVTGASFSEEGISIRHKVSQGFCDSEIRLPAMLIAGSSTDPLRLTSLMAQIQAKKKSPELIEADSVSSAEMKLLPRKESTCNYPSLNSADTSKWLMKLIEEAAE